MVKNIRKRRSTRRRSTRRRTTRRRSTRRRTTRGRFNRRRLSQKKKGNSPPNSPVSDNSNPYGFGGLAADPVPPHAASPKQKISQKQLSQLLEREKMEESKIFNKSKPKPKLKPKSNINKTSKKK